MPVDAIIVSHAHWDREWYLPFQEFRYRLVTLVDRILDTLAAETDFASFTLDGQTVVIEDYLALHPQREADLKRLMQSGRLLIGPWYVLPDEFLVSAESLVRNLLLGRRIGKTLGAYMAVGYVPDTFGHISQLPQILTLCGIDSVVLRRGLSDEPTQLWWQSPDGTRLLTIYLRDGYDNAAWFPADTPGFINAVRREVGRLVPSSPTPHILLMEGTDHIGLRLPGLPALIRAANEQLEDIRLRQGTLPEFISSVRGDVSGSRSQFETQKPAGPPTIIGELRSSKRHHLLAGVLSTRMGIKQRNDNAETALSCYAEPLAAVSLLLGGRDVRRELQQSWRYLLQNHAHDSICGCGIDQVHEEMQARFASSAQIAEMITTEGLVTLADHVRVAHTAAAGQIANAAASKDIADHRRVLSLTVFNPTSGPRTDYVTFSAPKLFPNQTWRLMDSRGQSLSMTEADWQMPLSTDRDLRAAGMLELLDRVASGWLDSRAVIDTRVRVQAKSAEVDLTLMELARPNLTDLAQFASDLQHRVIAGEVARFHVRTFQAGQVSAAFIARDVPGYGYRTYALETVARNGSGPLSKPTRARGSPPAGSAIENEFLRVSVDRRDGTLTLLDKRSGRVFRGLNRFQDGGDAGDEYNYCPPTHDHWVERPAAPPSIRIHDESPVGWRLEVAMQWRLPIGLNRQRDARSHRSVLIPIVTRVWLRPGIPRVDIESTVNNRVEDHRLRVLFPTPFQTKRACAEGHFDLVARGIPSRPDSSQWAEQPSPTAPQRGFVAVREGEDGLVIANHGLPEYELSSDRRGATIALTLLRCVGWLSRGDLGCRQGPAGPSLATPGAQCPGVHTFAYSLIPFAGSFTQAVQKAQAFRTPLRSIVAGPGDGRLPTELSFIELTPSELIVSAIKPAEDGDAWIVRFWNRGEDKVEGRLRIGFDVRSAERVNLLEESHSPLTVRDRRMVDLPVRAKQIVTVRLDPGPAKQFTPRTE